MNPAPASVAALIVTGWVPVDVRVTDCVAEVLVATLPNATLVALMLSVMVAGFSWRAKVLLVPLALADNVTVCAAATADTFAVKPTLVALAGTVTEPGTVTAELLLDRLTASPPLGAAAVSVTVHASVPNPVMVALLQDRVLSAAGPVLVAPVPFRVITDVEAAEEPLAIVNCPVAVPAAAGVNCTFKLYVPPGATVIGTLVEPTTAKGCPVRSTWAIWTGVEPAFESETEALAVWPTVTDPNATVLGDAVRAPAPTAFAAILPPQPDRANARKHDEVMSRAVRQPLRRQA